MYVKVGGLKFIQRAINNHGKTVSIMIRYMYISKRSLWLYPGAQMFENISDSG